MSEIQDARASVYSPKFIPGDDERSVVSAAYTAMCAACNFKMKIEKQKN